jgi:glutathione S-transferase
MFHIYGHPASRTFRIYWLLEELGLSYTFDPTSVKDASLPEFLKINPNAKIPALRDGDFYLFESAAIAYYICEKSRSHTLLPAQGSQERALVDQWMFWNMSELEQPIWWNSMNNHQWQGDLHISNFKKSANFEFNRHKKVLSDHLRNRDYLVGGSFSVADIFCSHTLNWAKGNDFIEPHETTLLNYIDRCKAKESFSKAKGLLKKI